MHSLATSTILLKFNSDFSLNLPFPPQVQLFIPSWLWFASEHAIFYSGSTLHSFWNPPFSPDPQLWLASQPAIFHSGSTLNSYWDSPFPPHIQLWLSSQYAISLSGPFLYCLANRHFPLKFNSDSPFNMPFPFQVKLCIPSQLAIFPSFLVACTRLYKPLCWSVGRLVGLSVGWSVGRSVGNWLLGARNIWRSALFIFELK